MRLVQRLRIVEFTLDHEAPYVSNMRRRNSRRAGAGGVQNTSQARAPQGWWRIGRLREAQAGTTGVEWRRRRRGAWGRRLGAGVRGS
jgi:hypothetical protein